MTAPTTQLSAALVRLLHQSAIRLHSRGEYNDALILHERIIAFCAELLEQGVSDLWPVFVTASSDRVRALTALGRHAEARDAERDTLSSLTPDAPPHACEAIAELLLERAAEPREGEGFRRAIALLERLPAGSPLREVLNELLVE